METPYWNDDFRSGKTNISIQHAHFYTEANKGKAFYTGLQGLGDIVFADYAKNKRRRM